MHAAGTNFHRNYQPDIDRLIDRLRPATIATFPPNDPQEAPGQGKHMDNDSKIACAELIQNWGFARDQGHWDDLNAIMHPGGEIAVSWFRGPYVEFVNHCRNNFGKRTLAKH